MAGHLFNGTVKIPFRGEPVGTGVFTLTLSEPSESDIAVEFTLSGSATAGEDFIVPENPAVITAGSMTATINIVVMDDPSVEGPEIVTATISPVEGTPVQGDPSATLTINDDDSAAIRVSPVSGLVTGEDGTSAEFTVVLSSPPSAPVTIAMESSDVTEGTISPNSLEFTFIFFSNMYFLKTSFIMSIL